MDPGYDIFPLGDSALTIDFGNGIDETTNNRVLQLFAQLQHRYAFLIDVVPAYSSLTVHFDVCALHTSGKTAFDTVRELLLPLLGNGQRSLQKSRQLRIPVCYAKQFAPDMAELAMQKLLPIDEVIKLHTAKTYRVYMIGFLPGFAYMGKVDEQLATPRRSQPRTHVAEGSVGIAGQQTGIYPLTSPGGWNIIGRTPVKIFDTKSENPVFFQPGDEVCFYSITEDEFADYQGGHT